jgi:hypothetical protein
VADMQQAGRRRGESAAVHISHQFPVAST